MGAGQQQPAWNPGTGEVSHGRDGGVVEWEDQGITGQGGGRNWGQGGSRGLFQTWYKDLVLRTGDTKDLWLTKHAL